MIQEAGTAPKKKRSHGSDEAKIQSECVRWLWNEHPETRMLYFCVPNELSTSSYMDKQAQLREGSKRRTMGCVSGVSDTILMIPSDGYHAACIEFKTPIGRQSDTQKEFQAKVEEKGYKYTLIRSVDDFKNFINKYLHYE
jgi:hypothetical protein